MSWQQELERIEKLSLDELNDKIDIINTEIDKAALEALTSIHFILAKDISDSKKIALIKEVEEKYTKIESNGTKYFIDKNKKEKFIKNPKEFEDGLKKVEEYAERLGSEDEGIS